MKRIKPYYCIIVLSLATILNLCFVSCSKDDEYVSPLKGMTISDVVVEATQNTANVSFGQADMSNCTVVTTASWCTAAISKSSVNVTVLENNTFEERIADITVTDTKDNTTVSFKVTQSQNDAIIIGSDYFEIPEEGKELNMEVNSNIEYVVDLSGTNWIKDVTPTRGLNLSEVKLVVDANTSGSVREATIKIKSKDGKTASDVKIKQLYTPVQITPSAVSMYFDDTAQLTANKAISWFIDNDFVAKVDENGLVTGRHVGNATITASNGVSSGMCSIEIIPKYKLYDNPILSWGASMSDIQAAEKHEELSTSSDLLAYKYSFNNTTCVLGYSFTNDKLTAVMAMMTYSAANYTNTGYYLLERFQPITTSGGKYFFIDSMTLEVGKMVTVAVLSTSGSGSSKTVDVTYYPHTPSSSDSNNSRMVQHNVLDTHRLESIIRGVITK